MMEHNEKYRQSVENDDLYQESHIAKVGSNEMAAMIKTTSQDQEEPIVPDQQLIKDLNPASTTSSLERIERDTASA